MSRLLTCALVLLTLPVLAQPLQHGDVLVSTTGAESKSLVYWNGTFISELATSAANIEAVDMDNVVAKLRKPFDIHELLAAVHKCAAN
jgi:hypothetical protein